jgi:hypothetical protein
MNELESNPTQTAATHENEGISRRTLLGGMAALSSMALLSACHGADTPAATKPSVSETTPELPIETRPPGRPSPLYVGPDDGYVTARDLSKPGDLNGLLNGKRMSDDGIAYHFIRVGRADEPIDGYLEASRLQAAEAEILPGYYYVVLPHKVMPIQRQAKWLVDSLIDTDLERKKSPEDITGMLALDIETTDKSENSGPSYEDAADFAAEFRRYVGHRTMLLYTAGWYWGDELQQGHLGNPRSLPGTELWWSHCIPPVGNVERKPPLKAVNGILQGPVQNQLDLIAAPGMSTDPYQGHRIGNYPYPTLRQFSVGSYYQQFQGQKVSLPYGRQNGEDAAVIDFNVSFKSWEHLLRLANLPVGALPYPQPLNLDGETPTI